MTCRRTQVEDVTFARRRSRLDDCSRQCDRRERRRDVAALAGARYDVGRQDTGIDEKMQAVTLMFTIDGVTGRRRTRLQPARRRPAVRWTVAPGVCKSDGRLPH